MLSQLEIVSLWYTPIIIRREHTAVPFTQTGAVTCAEFGPFAPLAIDYFLRGTFGLGAR
jgi:hypothetical protein